MPPELEDKPLVEAILELKWSPQGEMLPWKDPAYPLYVGTLYESIKGSYPHVEELPAKQVPDEITGGVVKYRFRRTANGWPLVQAGPGVATVNFTESYKWTAFRSHVLQFFPQLLQAYRFGGAYEGPFFTAAILRFINAVESDQDPLQFVSEKLHAEVKLPDPVAHATQISGAPSSIDVRLVYPISTPKGSGNIRIATGKKNDTPAVVWDLSVVSQGADAPQTEPQMDTWLTSAHALIETWFLAFVEGELLEQFGVKANANTG